MLQKFSAYCLCVGIYVRTTLFTLMVRLLLLMLLLKLGQSLGSVMNWLQLFIFVFEESHFRTFYVRWALMMSSI